ncbi:MAG: alpha/beta fold hydrolase [Bacteriovoracaceae bacterium]
MNNEYRDIVSFDGTPLKCLVRENGNSKWLIVSHGLGEHLGRHEYMLKLFSQTFNVAIYDLRGHGKSGGRPGYVEDFRDFFRDLDAVIEYLRKEFNLKDYALMGHSMGALVTAGYMQNLVKRDQYPEKVFLSAPVVGAPGAAGPLVAGAPSFLLEALCKSPTLPLGGILNLRKLSHDSRVYDAYVKDEYTHKKIHSKLLFEILRMAREVFSRPLRIECELFVALGTGDSIVSSELAIDYFREVEKSAQVRVYDGAYHELHNEVDKWRKPYVQFLRESLTGLSFEGL